MSTGTQSRRSPRRIAQVLFLLAAAAVAVSSLLPRRDLPTVSLSDKLEHALAYGVLGMLGGGASRSRRDLLYLFVLLCAMGGIIELLQTFSPGRTPDLADALADAAGAAVGLLLALPFALRRR